MYPARELTVLAYRRGQLLRRIELRRRRCESAADRLDFDVQRLSRWGRWLYLAGAFGAAGAGWFHGRRSAHGGNGSNGHGSAPSRRRLGSVLSWAPVVLRVARLVALRR